MALSVSPAYPTFAIEVSWGCLLGFSIAHADFFVMCLLPPPMNAAPSDILKKFLVAITLYRQL